MRKQAFHSSMYEYLSLALFRRSEGNQLEALEQVIVYPWHTAAIHQAKTFKVTCKISKNISKDF